MKKAILFAGIAFTLIISGCSNSSNEAKQSEATVEYTCPMHPDVLSDKPGSCPKCGMDLEQVGSMNNQMDSSMNTDNAMPMDSTMHHQ